ncbi:metal ABC transporter solute-binding protein, Zn/Mn family [Maribellus comscasis]|uniref:metal ABC transporter solute-binding protein, Zn/Mn family n=1 Tax=Maribellus comscasis TaxID=2681766 RepID=UPI003CCE3C2A
MGKAFILFHPSLSYYAHGYGVVQYFLEPGRKQPTPRRMAELVKNLRNRKISG